MVAATSLVVVTDATVVDGATVVVERGTVVVVVVVVVGAELRTLNSKVCVLDELPPLVALTR